MNTNFAAFGTTGLVLAVARTPSSLQTPITPSSSFTAAQQHNHNGSSKARISTLIDGNQSSSMTASSPTAHKSKANLFDKVFF